MTIRSLNFPLQTDVASKLNILCQAIDIISSVFRFSLNSEPLNPEPWNPEPLNP